MGGKEEVNKLGTDCPINPSASACLLDSVRAPLNRFRREVVIVPAGNKVGEHIRVSTAVLLL